MTVYEGIDSATRRALQSTEAELLAGSACPVRIHEDADAMRVAMAERLFDDITGTLVRQPTCTLIVPVGPVGQYELLAERCVKDGISLSAVTFIIMDEYLDLDGNWVGEHDALSFRGHIHRNLRDRMPEALRPQIVIPDPHALEAIPDIIARRGLDFTYAGVGITGHLAFNDPVPGRDDPDWFAGLGTRVVSLLPETRLINSVTAAFGNVQRIPQLAVTVGMKEILSAAMLRIWMNRHWQCAAIRRMLLGPVTAAFPASLVQRHPNATLDVVREVLAEPEPRLR